MADLSLFETVSAADEGAWLTLLDISGLETDARILLAGEDSKAFRQARHNHVNNRLQKGRDGITSEAIEESDIAILAKCTLDWKNMGDLNCSFETAKQVYKKFPHIRRQVDQFIGLKSNFVKVIEGKSEPSANGVSA